MKNIERLPNQEEILKKIEKEEENIELTKKQAKTKTETVKNIGDNSKLIENEKKEKNIDNHKLQKKMMEQIDKDFSEFEKEIILLNLDKEEKDIDKKLTDYLDLKDDLEKNWFTIDDHKKTIDYFKKQIYKKKIKLCEDWKKNIDKNIIDTNAKRALNYLVQEKGQKIINKTIDIIEGITPERSEKEILAESFSKELNKKDEETKEKNHDELIMKIHNLAEKYASGEQHSDDSIRQANRLVHELSESTETQPKIFIKNLMDTLTDGNKKIHEFYQKMLDLFEFEYNNDDENKNSNPKEKTTIIGNPIPNAN